MESGKENPYSCVVLGGARSQKERQRSLESFKDGDVRFLIATDVAARGIDVAQLPFVIQLTLPDDIENYIHRIGRCGRAERMGLAISLAATTREKVWYHKCPSKGKSCVPSPGNTKLTIPFGQDGKMLPPNPAKLLVDEGGCATWYDEPELLKKVEARIGGPVHVMDPEDFFVSDVIESPLEDGRGRRGNRMWRWTVNRQAAVRRSGSRQNRRQSSMGHVGTTHFWQLPRSMRQLSNPQSLCSHLLSSGFSRCSLKHCMALGMLEKV